MEIKVQKLCMARLSAGWVIIKNVAAQKKLGCNKVLCGGIYYFAILSASILIQ